MEKEKQYGSSYLEEQTRNEEVRIDLLQMARILLGKWYLLVIAGVLAATLAFGFSYFFVEPKYETTITLNVENSRMEFEGGGISSSDIVAATYLAETYRIILGSNSIMEEMVIRLGEKGVTMTENELKACTDISIVNDTQILRVTITGEDKELGYLIASVYEEVAPEMTLKLTNWGNIYVVDHARMAESPVSPSLSKVALMAFFAGVLMCALAIFMNKFMDRRVYCPDDIERELQLSVIGEIPLDTQVATNGVGYRCVSVQEGN